MCHLKIKYKSNDGFINYHQEAHSDYKVTFPNVIIKLSAEKKGNK